MNKKELLEKINGDLNALNEAYGNLYRNKVYVVVGSNSINAYYKTKRGAQGWIRKNEDYSYYDDYFMDLCIVMTEIMPIKFILTDEEIGIKNI